MTTIAPRDHRTDRRAQRIARLRDAAYRIRLNALNEGEVQGQGYIGQALGVADVLAVAYTDQLRYRADDPHWAGRDRFLLSIGHYAIALYAALAEAGSHPGRGAGDLRLRRVAAADVGHGLLHAGHGDLRRLAGPRPRRRHRDGARAAPPGQPRPRLQPALGRRARRGLHLGGGTADRPPPPGQRHRDRRRQRPAGRRPHRRHPAHRARHRQVAGVRLARPAGRRQRHRSARRRLRRAARPQGLARGADLRHPHRPRRAAAGDPGEGALHARVRARSGRPPATSSPPAHDGSQATTPREPNR